MYLVFIPYLRTEQESVTCYTSVEWNQNIIAAWNTVVFLAKRWLETSPVYKSGAYVGARSTFSALNALKGFFFGLMRNFENPRERSPKLSVSNPSMFNEFRWPYLKALIIFFKCENYSLQLTPESFKLVPVTLCLLSRTFYRKVVSFSLLSRMQLD